MLATILTYCSWAARGVLSALLPAPERDRIAAGHPISPPDWSCALGAIGGLVGLMLYIDGALGYMGPLGGEQAFLLLDSPKPGFGRLAGIMTWLTWHLQPEAWLYMYLALMGLLRVVAFAATRQAVAEPAILAPLRAIQWLGGRGARRRRLLQLGLPRPDRLLWESGGNLLVLSCREKQDWDELTTIKIAGRFYRLIDVADRQDGRSTAIAYRLGEIESTDVVRKLVKTDLRPPPGHHGASKTAPAGRLWYFAFGPTMLPATLHDEVPDARFLCVARLGSHALRFEKPAADGSGEAAAVATNNPSDITWGVVWQLDEGQLENLQDLERIGPDCHWQDVEVGDVDGRRYVVKLAVVDRQVLDSKLRPQRGHRDQLVEAARRHGFPGIYAGLLAAAPLHGDGPAC